MMSRVSNKAKRSRIKLGMIAGFFVFPAVLTAANASAASITVTVDTSGMVLNLAPKTTSGDFSESGNGTISVTATGGYTLGLASYTGSTSLNSGSDSITSISSDLTKADFSNASNTSYNNHWGYKPSQYVNGSGTVVNNTGTNAVFRSIPNDDGEILDIVNNPNGTKNYTLSLGARANLDTPKGSYVSDTFVITAIGNAKCNPDATIISTAHCMQDINDDVINSMVMNKQYKLIDERDDKVYYVAKMKDGNVWMTQNLDLDLNSNTSSSNYVALTSKNTDLNTFGSQGYTTANGYTCSNTSTTTNCTAAGEYITWVPSRSTSTDATAWVNETYTPNSFDYQDHYYYTDTTGASTAYDSKSACEAAHNDDTCPHYHLGNYYNFNAAVASNSTSEITSSMAVGNSICPAGWRLPGRLSSFSDTGFLLRDQGIATSNDAYYYRPNGYLNISNAPIYLARGGYKASTSVPTEIGTSGNYVLNYTYYSNVNKFAFNSSSISNLYMSGNRNHGNSVRCIARRSNTGHTVITFDKNSSEATGTMNTQTVNANATAYLPAGDYVRSGYSIATWNTEADGSGISYTIGSSSYGTTFHAAAGTNINNVTLYAQWALNRTITFDKNASDATGTMGSQTINGGASAALTSNAFSRSGYAFNGWSTNPDGTGTSYNNGASYSVPADNTEANVTLYAKWIPIYTITFYANGGTGNSYTQTIAGNVTDYLYGNQFTRSNYYFKGWSTSSGASNTVEYRAGQALTPSSNMTLYAVWGSSTSTSLYDIVASLNYNRTLNNYSNNGSGLNAYAGIKSTSITKDNSGVFTYNSSVFGTPSDATNTSTIYLYRGILDGNLDGTSSTYGSNGDSANYPNYVKLGNICWRIVRTTGSGGVKMIYNGSYSGGTTANSCANAQTNAQTTYQTSFGIKGSSAQTTYWYRNLNRTGYTFNNSSSIADVSTNTSVDTIFGSNSNYSSTNTTNSNAKSYAETYYGADNYVSILEPSAGYCNDRTIYSSSAGGSPLASIEPYTTSGYAYFGAQVRNIGSQNYPPSLNCGSSNRNTVDLYTTSSASDGNKQLSKPVALLTADEASFAGSGASPYYGSAYNVNSFLRSGSDFWLLSPSARNGGYALGFLIGSSGNLTSQYVSYSKGIRPVVSLKSGVTPASGSGTATDPWVVESPPYMQDFTASQCQTKASNAPFTVIDRRDGSDYTVRYINGNCWMTQNLRITGTISAIDSNFSSPASFNTAGAGDLRVAYNTYYDSQSHLADSTDVTTFSSLGYTTKQLGAWYNICAASAGQVCSNTRITPTQSICPANWTLPDYSQAYGVINYASSFSPIYSGFFYNTSVNTSYGNWWTTRASMNTDEYALIYSNGSLDINSGAMNKSAGNSIRCVRST